MSFVKKKRGGGGEEISIFSTVLNSSKVLCSAEMHAGQFCENGLCKTLSCTTLSAKDESVAKLSHFLYDKLQL